MSIDTIHALSQKIRQTINQLDDLKLLKKFETKTFVKWIII